jgi:hypothetical protein
MRVESLDRLVALDQVLYKPKDKPQKTKNYERTPTSTHDSEAWWLSIAIELKNENASGNRAGRHAPFVLSPHSTPFIGCECPFMFRDVILFEQAQCQYVNDP